MSWNNHLDFGSNPNYESDTWILKGFFAHLYNIVF